MKYLQLVFLVFFSNILQAKNTKQLEHDLQLAECHFRMIDSNDGKINIFTETKPYTLNYFVESNNKMLHGFDMSINFYCKTSLGMENAFERMGFIQFNGKWQLDPKEQPLPEEHMKFYSLNEKSWSGAAYTIEQTTGPYKRRSTQLAFCLSNKVQTLCGGSEMVGFTAYPKESALPKVLKLLQSIEFINSSDP